MSVVHINIPNKIIIIVSYLFLLEWELKIVVCLQSILTVTFEVAGDLSENALNVFIQVRHSDNCCYYWWALIQ